MIGFVRMRIMFSSKKMVSRIKTIRLMVSTSVGGSSTVGSLTLTMTGASFRIVFGKGRIVFKTQTIVFDPRHTF